MVFEYLLLFFCTIPLTMLGSFGLAPLFAKAGEDPKKAFIPVVNQLTFLKIAGKHPSNIILEYVPVINIFSFVLDLIDFARCYNVKSFWQQMATLFGYPVYFLYLGKKEDVKYLGTLKEIEATQPKSKWYSSLLFAVVAATIIRWAFIEAYKIPTSSMEGSMLVDDFLFVSKIHYGPRTPQTPLQMPLTHQQFPIIGGKSYSEAIKLPSFRFPGLSTVQRNKPLVFNWPYDQMVDHTDMKTFYVKRCVAVAGDTLAFVDGQLYVNGKKVEDNETQQYKYSFRLAQPVVRDTILTRNGNNEEISVERLKGDVAKDWKIANNEDFSIVAGHPNVAIACLSKSNYGKVANSKYVVTNSLLKEIFTKGDVSQGPIFPYMAETGRISTDRILPDDLLNEYKFKWNVDNFGPLWVPKAGVTIAMNRDNVTLYASTISRYEGYDRDEVVVANGKLLIQGKEVTTYSFKQNYYWLVGDNRHNSFDSRYWGFVPEDHVVGKPFITFFSMNKYATGLFDKVRWNRIFRFVE
jgi:signal peptidase I